MRRNADDLVADARGVIRRLEPAEAHAAMAGGAVLIDTRPESARAQDGVIPGATWIPLNVLEWRVDPDSPHKDPTIGGLDQQVIVICMHGFSSSLAAARLKQLGFDQACDVIGGFEAWAAARLPVESDKGQEG